MRLEYVVLSADEKSSYIDYWPIVAGAWREIVGLRPVLGYVCEDVDQVPSEMADHGMVVPLPYEPKWDWVNQAQICRLWVASQLGSSGVILSDIDMLPLDRGYFIDSVADLPDESLVSYSSDVLSFGLYLKRPQYPICYLAARGSTFSDILELDGRSWLDFCAEVRRLPYRRSADQRHFYSKAQAWHGFEDRFVGLARGWEDGKANHRIDKVDWSWSAEDVRAGRYFDAHLPRPFSEWRDSITSLCRAAGHDPD